MEKQQTEERFWSKVKKTKNCWEWVAAVKPSGYGSFSFKRMSQNAHRVAFILTYKTKLLSTDFICHKCDNRLCVRPDHMFIGNHKLNSKDMTNKGRSFNQKKKFCESGHPFDENNTKYSLHKGVARRICHQCRKRWQKKYDAKRRPKK